ncbi:hypothetical protein Tco_0566287 [Tanacetum coccineum]
MTGNKAYLAEFQDFNGGPVAFGGSKGYITSKGDAFVKGNLSQSPTSKLFQNDHTCVACQKESNTRPPGSRWNIEMPELHNKMELLKERTGPLLRLQGPMLAVSFLPNNFLAEAVSTAVLCSKKGKFAWENQMKVSSWDKFSTKQGFRKGPTWLFDLYYLTDSMNYHPVSSENQANLHAGQQEANQNAGTKEIIDVGDSDKEDESAQDCFVLPIWPSYTSTTTPAITTADKREGPREEEQVFMDDLERLKGTEKDG